MRKLFAAIWLAAVVSLPALATTYYVSSSSGNDANNGTAQATPWKTLAKVNATTLAAGDSVLLRRGDTWRESLIPKSSGTSTNYIYFDAYGSGLAPSLTGYQDLPSALWSLVSGNVWQAAVSASGVNNVLFGSIWGQKQTSQSALQHERDFYFSGTALMVYARSNPVTYYGSVAAITTAASQLIYVNGKSWLQFQHISLSWFDGFGVNVAGASDHLLFANMEANGMVPSGTLPHGFYVNASTPGDIKFYNDDAHLNYDGFRFEGAATAITLVNCKAYANRDGGLVDYTNHATYSYSHFYANNIAILNSQDVQGGPIDGGHNLPADTPPAILNFATYPAQFIFTVDDVGFAPGTETYIDSLLPVFNARGLKLSAAVVAGYSSGLISEIQSWLASGHDINSHSWSHQYYTNTNAFTIRYIGSGTAASLTISGNHLATTVTGGPGGEDLNFDLTSAGYDTASELVLAINARGVYTATLDANCRTAAHTIGFADVSAHDIRTSTYTVLFQKDRLEPDELTSSRTWLQTNISGLPDVKVMVYPDGIEDTQTQGWAVTAGYEGARGALSIGLGSNFVYSKGVNIQNITSLGAGSLHGLTAQQVDAKIAALVFKASVWGVPYGLFDHIDDLTPDEVAMILDSLAAHGASVINNTQLMDSIAGMSSIPGTTSYVSPPPGATPDFHLTTASPILNAGQNLGSAFNTDLQGIARSQTAAWDIGAYGQLTTAYGAGSGAGSFTIGSITGAGCGGPPNYCAYKGIDPVQFNDLSVLRQADGSAGDFGNLVNSGLTLYDTSFVSHGQPANKLAPITRCTDTNTSPGTQNKYVTYSAGLGGSGGAVLFNSNSTLLHVNGAGDNIIQFNPTTGQCAPHMITQDMNLASPGSSTKAQAFDGGQFSLTDPSIYYAIAPDMLVTPIQFNWTNSTSNAFCGTTTSPGQFCYLTPLADLSLALPIDAAEWQPNHRYTYGQHVAHTLNPGAECPDWAPGTAEIPGNLICPDPGGVRGTNPSKNTFKALKSFTVSSTEPDWTKIGGSTTDGSTPAAWRGMSGDGTSFIHFIFELTDIASCSPNCAPANAFTSGSSVPVFVPADTHHPDLLTTVSDGAGTWTNIGTNSTPGWGNNSMVSRDGTRVSGSTSFDNYGYNGTYTNWSGGQGTGISMVHYVSTSNTYSHYNMGTGIITDKTCVGGNGYNCAGGHWQETVLGKSANLCHTFNHGGKTGPLGIYVHTSTGANITPIGPNGCPGANTFTIWQPELKPSNDPNWANNVVKPTANPGNGFNHPFWVDNYEAANSGNYSQWVGDSTFLFKVPFATVEDGNTYIPVWSLNPLGSGPAPNCDPNWTPTNPPNPLPPCNPGLFDRHPMGFGDNGTMCTSFYGYQLDQGVVGLPIHATWQNEAICVSMDTSDPAQQRQWRFSHLFHSQTNPNFDTQFAISQLSQDLKWLAITTDLTPIANGSGSFGSTTGTSSCLGGYPWQANHTYSANYLIDPIANLQGSGSNYGVFKSAAAGTSSADSSTYQCSGPACVWGRVTTPSDNHVALPLPDWSISTPSLNSYIQPVASSNTNDFVYQATAVSGPTAGTQPTWSGCQTVGCTVTDGGVTWTNRGTTDTVQDGTLTWAYQGPGDCRGDVLIIKLW